MTAADEPLEGLTVTDSPAERKAQDERVERVLGHADALIHRVDQGAPFTLDDATKAVGHTLGMVSRADLPAVVAYLACQVAGYRRSADVDSRLALTTIESVVAEWRGRHRRPGPRAVQALKILRKAGQHDLADWVAGHLPAATAEPEGDR